jgi:hypothetical protein
MTLKTIGTAATTTLQGAQIPPSYNATPQISDADWASIKAAILDDVNPTHPIWPGALERKGMLYLPRNRGFVRLHAGDWVAFDPTGWPVVISNYALPQTLTASGTTTNLSTSLVFTSSVLALGWQVGMPISGTNVPASTVISAISLDGLTVTMSKAATGSATNTMTVNGAGWTHN